MMEEEWRDIKGCEWYQVSNLGRVRNSNGRILASNEINSGYLMVSFKKYHKARTVHRLVAEAFIPNPVRQVRQKLSIHPRIALSHALVIHEKLVMVTNGFMKKNI